MSLCIILLLFCYHFVELSVLATPAPAELWLVNLWIMIYSNGVNDDIHWTLWDGVIMYTEHNTHFGIFYQQRVGKGKPLVLQLME